MRLRWFHKGLIVLGLLGLVVLPATAGFDESQDPSSGKSRVQRLNAEPSPSPGASHINDYINQDEQLNLTSRDGVVKVLRTDQKIMLNDYVAAVFPLRYALPREMRNVMRTVTGIEGGRAEVILDKEKKQNFLQVVAPREMIPYLRDAVASLDVPWFKDYWDGSQDMYYKAQHRDVQDIDLIARNYAGDDGFTVIDKTNNAIRRYDDEYRNGKYAEAAALVDIPANQVLLDVKMYEVAANNDTKLGLDFIAWKNGPGRNLFQFVFTAFDADQRAKGVTSVFDPFLDARTPASNNTRTVLDAALVSKYAAANYLIAADFVDFLQAKGKARLVNSQKLMVASSLPAVITASRQVLAIVNNENEIDKVTPDRPTPVRTWTNSGNNLDSRVVAFDGAAATIPENVHDKAPASVAVEDSGRRVRLRNAGVVTTELEVVPYVGLESMELDLKLEIDDANGVSPSGLPIINKRIVNSTVRLLDGQPYVIAAMRHVNNSSNTAKVPWLGSIPVLGWAFGGETNLRREDRMVIVITPHFLLATQKGQAAPPSFELIKAIVDGKAPLPTPENHVGYDQWLLGSLAAKD